MENMFENVKIRTAYDKQTKTRWFSVVDVVSALTGSEYAAARNYWKWLKRKLQDDEQEQNRKSQMAAGQKTQGNAAKTKKVSGTNQLALSRLALSRLTLSRLDLMDADTNPEPENHGDLSGFTINQLKLEAADGKLRFTDVMTAEEILHLIQICPSPKAAAFKKWIADLAAGGKKVVKCIENAFFGAKDMVRTKVGRVIATTTYHVFNLKDEACGTEINPRDGTGFLMAV